MNDTDVLLATERPATEVEIGWRFARHCCGHGYALTAADRDDR